jgi:RimJ/RimL family protein N-acetyltransferase
VAKDLGSLHVLTPRLLLRPLQMVDFESWAAFMADPEATRFLGGAQPRALAWRGFMTMAGAWHLQGFSMFSVIERSSQRWVGRLGPWMPDGWPGTEVGWGIIRDCWGRGYAVEGATAAIDWAFDELGWSEVIHAIDPTNGASQAVARKLGSELIGTGRLPEPIDTAVEIWGQSRAAWCARRGQRRSQAREPSVRGHR